MGRTLAFADPPPEGARRTQDHHVLAILVSPVLLAGDRKWKFRTTDQWVPRHPHWERPLARGEFAAAMRDRAFLRALLAGEIDVRLRGGLLFDMNVEVAESWRRGAWRIARRTVTEVCGWREAPASAAETA